ncbi:TTL-domain-containing protein, partial [Fistulina hepatica ATCC 64428]
ALVSWPSAPFTKSLVLKAITSLAHPPSVIFDSPCDMHRYLQSLKSNTRLLQWSTYDDIDHERSLLYRNSTLSSSYTIRKALIRKHFLSRTIHAFCTKHPTSLLSSAVPRSYEVEISFSDELDELFADDLYDLSQDLDNGGSWWILKPGMADRGDGIRLFDNKKALREIFEEFEEDSSDEERDETEEDASEGDASAGIVISQLRHFVIQEYIPNPLLIDPREFHLRAYCVVQGALRVYLYDRVLALFSAVPYTPPRRDEVSDLAPHLTNSSLQTHRGEDGVRLFDELLRLTESHITSILDQIRDILAEIFRAALENVVHFQPVPNGFELFGIDFLVSYNGESSPHSPFSVCILEVNSEPAIELTGPRLSWILEDLFETIAKVCVEPFFSSELDVEDCAPARWTTAATEYHFIKCLDEQVR